MDPNALYAVLVLCARDVDKIFDGLRAAGDAGGNPPLPPAPDNTFGYLTQANWRALGQLRCDDEFIQKGTNCYFGLMLQCIAPDPPFAAGDFMVAVRGTVTPLEWVDDGLSEFPDYLTGNVGGVGTGFWGLYSSMTYAQLDGSNSLANPAQVIIDLVKDPGGATRTLWVTGHSLGAALATYLTADLQKRAVGTSVAIKPYFFASPRPGTQDYADNYQASIPSYDLVNYVADLDPNVPSNPPFYTLNGGGASHNVHIIARALPGAPAQGLDPMTNVANNHSPVTYARMLDPNNQVARRLNL